MRESWKFVWLLLCIGAMSPATASVNNESSVKNGHAFDTKQLLLQASKGDKTAEMELGNIYYHGLGVPKDPSQAFKWYMECAKRGDPDAQAYVGEMYANGLGVDKNFVKSLVWLRRSSAQGSPHGEYELAEMYSRGFGTQDEQKQLTALVSKSASQQYAPAEYWLGTLAYYGNKSVKDYHRALRYFLMAAYDNNAAADYYLAKMYLKGDGVTQDDVIAYAFIENATEHLGKVDKMDADQINDLQRRVKAKLSSKELADAEELVSDANFTGQCLVNVLALRVYQATGKSLLGSTDPLHDPGIGPVVIDIDEKGVVSLFGRTVELPALKQKLRDFLGHAPRPEVQVNIKGIPIAAGANQSFYTVVADIKELKLSSLSLVTRQQR